MQSAEVERKWILARGESRLRVWRCTVAEASVHSARNEVRRSIVMGIWKGDWGYFIEGLAES